jgi:hypothetical protein
MTVQLSASILVILVTASTVGAECIAVPPSVQVQNADLVFSGTLVGREQILGDQTTATPLRETLTFAVTRIWKGVLPSPATARAIPQVTVFQMLHVESYHFEPSTEYVLFAQALKPSDSEWAWFPAAAGMPRYLIHTCGGRPDPPGVLLDLEVLLRRGQ